MNRAQGWAYLSNFTWAGYVADQNLCSYSIQGGGYGETGIGCAVNTPNYYSEVDTDYNVPCIANGGNGIGGGDASSWIGVGGTYNHNGVADELIQTGAESDENYILGLPNYAYWTWWEYVNANYAPDGIHTVTAQAFNISGDPNNNTTGRIDCGTHIYARVDACNHMELGNLNTGHYYSVYEGPCTMGASAEFITECGISGSNCANYGWVTFHGVGLTVQDTTNCASGCYIPMTSAEKDIIWNKGPVTGYADQNVGSLQSDSGDPPGDKFSNTWLLGD